MVFIDLILESDHDKYIFHIELSFMIFSNIDVVFVSGVIVFEEKNMKTKIVSVFTDHFHNRLFVVRSCCVEMTVKSTVSHNKLHV